LHPSSFNCSGAAPLQRPLGQPGSMNCDLPIRLGCSVSDDDTRGKRPLPIDEFRTYSSVKKQNQVTQFIRSGLKTDQLVFKVAPSRFCGY
ncbi:MAG: hypothetical protein PVG19_03210, partial [Desulfobacterales bacterium]